ncbi:MAG: Maf family nucleotide pyrophosphatase [Rubrivivax sp.]
MPAAAPTTPTLILASTSPYRRELLNRLGLHFEVVAPAVDESAQAGETSTQLVLRLALAKANAVASQRSDAVVIGSDQVADLNGDILGKPGNHERATEQLRRLSAKRALFHTAVAVVAVERGATRFERVLLATVAVQFRRLDDAEIESYLVAERPYDCAGSAKSETRGIALLDSIESDDPTALIGLPLMRTCQLLRAAGIDPLLAGARRADTFT